MDTVGTRSFFDRHFSLFTVPAAFVLLFLPKLYSFALGFKFLDPADPKRYQPAVLKSDELDDKTKGRIIRAEAAFANGLETIALFAAAVAAVHAVPVRPAVANVLALLYLASRLVYTVVYVVLRDNPRWALVRSLTWFGGIAVVLALYVVAGVAAY